MEPQKCDLKLSVLCQLAWFFVVVVVLTYYRMLLKMTLCLGTEIFRGSFCLFFFFFYNSRNILVMKVKTRLRKSCVRDRSLFMWGGGGDFFCFSMKEKT